MDEPAISARSLSKRFVLRPQRGTSLKERIIRRKAAQPPSHGRELWALRDATFDVGRGETFGIIGHNGSGKSTALKVIAGVYEATSGVVEVHGRVSALLELGAGFHPELTGRENIRLNGAILGLTKRETDDLMEQIIDFSGIEAFIDEPVKVYSSGMFVRLGFAIAAKIEPDILIMDEVISVGDEDFQRKCFDHLYRLREGGTTILLVSHSLPQVEVLCDRAMWLDHGHVRALGPARDTVQAYIDSVNEAEAATDRQELSPGDAAPAGTAEAWVTDVEFLDSDGEPNHVLIARREATVRIHFRVARRTADMVIGFMACDADGRPVAGRNTMERGVGPLQPGTYTIDYRIPDLLLSEGRFLVTTMISRGSRILNERPLAFTVTVRSNDTSSGGPMHLPGGWTTPTPERSAEVGANQASR